MADMTEGYRPVDDGAQAGTLGARASLMVQVTGAVLSVALLGGVAVWGYRLVVRDAEGIPVVRAMAGPMRIAPDNPGGAEIQNTGLAVNAVAAAGEAEAPADRLELAPVVAGLTEEDLTVEPTADAAAIAPEMALSPLVQPEPEAEPEPITFARDDSAPMSAEDILALADQIAGDAAPLEALTEAPIAPVAELAEAEAAPEVEAEALVAEVPAGALERALRPPTRPTGVADAVALAVAEATEAPVPATQFAVHSDQIPLGTVLVQLGAFDTPEVAGSSWERLSGQFEEFMSGKERVIQQAQSGGRDFFRLRALGFENIDEARRFCSALVAEDAPCIPVVVQ